MKKRDYITKCLIILFGLTAYIQDFGTIDRIGEQWLFLSSLNIISIIFIYFNRTEKVRVSQTSLLTIFFASFIITSLPSLFFSGNLQESFITLSYYTSVLTSLIILITLSKSIENSKEFILKVLLIGLFLEDFFVFKNILSDFLSNNYLTLKSPLYRGLTPNVNITSYSIVFKVPILLYFISKNNNPAIKFFLSFILFITFICLYVLTSRGAIIILCLLLILYFTRILWIKNKIKFLFSSGIILGLLLVSFFIVNSSSRRASFLVERANTISFNKEDSSINSRIRYYSHAISSIIDNPLGIGVGNWKLKSIEYDKNDMSGFIVPYHVHNDFLQIGAENGIISLFCFISLFICLAYFFVKKRYYKDEIYFVLILSVVVYLFDSMFNFPISRPINVLNLLFVLSILNNILPKINLFKGNYFIFIFILSSVSTFSNYKVYKSFLDQKLLMFDYNNSKNMIDENKALNEIQSEYPNITLTTIPIEELLANILIKKGRNEEALLFLSKNNNNHNPYLGFRENLLNIIYDNLGNKDSSLYYNAIAFNKLPNNKAFSSQLLNKYSIENDTLRLKNIFKGLKIKGPLDIKNFLNGMLNYRKINDKELRLYSDTLLAMNPDDNLAKRLASSIKIGKNNYDKSQEYQLFAENRLDNNQWNEAIKFYRLSDSLFPNRITIKENIAICYTKQKKYLQAKNEYKKIIKDFKNEDVSKAKFYLALILIKENKTSEACRIISKLVDKNYKGSVLVFQNFCKN